ncbi:MAG: ABC transporter permease, partial [Candidatus Tectomicrobia bacterium]|nr:ABC transporter permease [Candidatus Tectomicrobia bacterium]
MDAQVVIETEEVFSAEPSKFSRWGIAIIGIVVFAALFAPWISPYDYRVQNMLNTFANPSRAHLLGTDQFGRDILSRILWGSRASLIVGLEATLLGGIVGTLIGMIAGYKGGTIDHLVTRLVDMMMAIPTLIMSLMIMVALGPSLHHTALAIAISMTPKFIRL